MAHIGASIAKAQITNGGPVILVQPENEYSGSVGPVTGGFPDAGIVVPFVNNDACKTPTMLFGYIANFY
jgi:hypothetical protein